MLTLLILATTSFAADGPPLNGMALSDAYRSLPPCNAVKKPEVPTLDLQKGCIAGACAGMTKEEIDEALQDTGECKETKTHSKRTYCDWLGERIQAVFYDFKGPKASALWAQSDDWRDPDGLGLGSRLTCFLDRYGENAVGLDVRIKEGWLLWDSIQFKNPPIIINVGEDGTVRKIQLNYRRGSR